jgi:O-antigen ligase
MISDTTHNQSGYFIFLSGIFLACLAATVFTSFYWLSAIPFLFLLFYFGWQQWQLIFFLLIFSLPWSVEYNFTSFLGTDLPDEPLMLLTAVLFIAHLFFSPSASALLSRHPLILLLFFYFGWIIITVPFSTDWLISLKFLLAKGWYLAAFVFAPLLIFKNKKSIQATGLVFLSSMLIVIFIAVYRHYVLGFSFANINAAVRPFFRNHVNYSSMLVCTIPVLVAICQLNKKWRVFAAAAIIIVLFALVVSYARGAWLAAITGLFSYWLIKKRKLLIAFLIGMSLIVVSVCWLSSNDRYLQYAHDYRTTIFHKDFEEHLVATYKLKDVSTAERFNRWVAGIRMMRNNWLTGYGPNTFYYNYKPYAIPAFKTWVSANKEHSTVHNYFLLVLIEQGIPGLLFFLLLVGGMLYYSENLYKRLQDKFYKAAAMACGVMLMMIIVVNFLSDLIETDKVGSLFFLCLAALVAIDLNTREIKDKS